MVKNKKIILLFLGNYTYDARCINMTDSLIKDNHQVTIISETPSNNLFQSHDSFTNKKIILPKNGILRYYKFHQIIKKKLNQIKFDVLIACDIFSLAAVSKYYNQKKIIYDNREIYSQLHAHKNKPLYKYFWKFFEKYYIKYTNIILFTADSDKKYLSKIYPIINQKKLSVIYNYPKYSPLSYNKNIRKHFNLSSKTKIILYQGVIQSGRGIKKLIHVIKSLNNVVAVCVGDGENLKEYIHLVDKLNLNNKFFFTGKLPYTQILQYASDADLGWLIINKKSKSNELALPNKFFEYLLMGLPVLSNNLPNIKPIIKKYKIGHVVLDDTVNNLSFASKKMLSENYTKENIHNISKNFTWQKQHNQFIRLISYD